MAELSPPRPVAGADGASGVRRRRRQGAGAGRRVARCSPGSPELLHDHRVGIGGGGGGARRRSARWCLGVRRPGRPHHRRAGWAALRVRRPGVSRCRGIGRGDRVDHRPAAHRADVRDHAAHRRAGRACRGHRLQHPRPHVGGGRWDDRPQLRRHVLPFGPGRTRGTRSAALQPRRAHHTVAPRRQRPADRCRCDGLAQPRVRDRPSQSDVATATPGNFEVSRRTLDRSVLPDRSRTSVARRRRRRWRRPRRSWRRRGRRRALPARSSRASRRRD